MLIYCVVFRIIWFVLLLLLWFIYYFEIWRRGKIWAGWIIKVCRVCSILFSSIFLSLDLALQCSEKMVNFIPLVHFSNENNVYRCINKVFFCLVSREMSKISARLKAKILIYKAFSYFLIWHRYHTLFLLRDLLFAPVCPFV